MSFHDVGLLLMRKVGVTFVNYELCSFLINEGADPNYQVIHHLQENCPCFIA
jgi:hypothetical protein